MSHTIRMKIKLTDIPLLQKVVGQHEGAHFVTPRGTRVATAAEARGTFKQYSESPAGIGIKLPDWQYPVVVGDDGVLAVDNFNGHWGDQVHLDSLVQAYSVAKTRQEAAISNMLLASEKQLTDGTVVLEFESNV